MRKLSTLLSLLLLCTLGAFAQLAPSFAVVSAGDQVMSVSDITDGELYLIKSKGLTVDPSATSGRQFAQERADGIIRFALPNALDADCLFKLVSDGNGGFYIQSNSGNWFKGIAVANDDATSTVAESERAAFTFDATGTAGEFRMHNNGHRENIGGGGESDPTLKPGKDTSSSDWSIFYIYKAVLKTTKDPFFVTETGANFLKAGEVIDKANNGTLFVSLQLHTTSSNNYLNSGAKVQSTFASDGSTSWEIVPYNDYYVMKNVKTGTYIGNAARPTTFTSDIASATKFTPMAVDNAVGDIAAGYTAQGNAIRWKVAPAHSVWINANGASSSTTVQFNGGTGNWTCWFTYENSKRYYLTFLCYDENDNFIQAIDATDNYADGQTVDVTTIAPDILGYTFHSAETSSVTFDGDSKAVKLVYQQASSFDYTIVVNDAPTGASVTINSDDVTNLTSYNSSSILSASDVVVTFPTEYSYMAYRVSIDGTTITVDCYDPRWPINFSKDQKYTRTDRFINNVRIGSKTFPITNDGFNTPAYRDFTSDVLVVPAGATLVPAIGYQGQWMHGFFYVDLDNDGTFYVANPGHQTAANTEYNGELLSYGNEGNALNSSHQEMPAFTMPTTPGDYRARFKLDWASTDPGGNPGADVNDVTSSNHIIANGGTIVDITLRILPPADVTYVVVDESNNELFRATETVGIGDIVTELPEAYKRTNFYDYNTVDVTVTGDMEITFTATKKADAPIQYSADADNAIWYFLTIKPDNTPETSYPFYVEGGTPNVTLPTTRDYSNASLWAFVGSPYTGFNIINKAAGGTLVLGSANAADDGANGGNTYATMAEKGTQDYEVWTIRSSSYATELGGIYIYNAAEQYLNRRSADNLAYWTGGHDMGSTFVVTTPTTAFNTLADNLESMDFGTGLNQYSLIVEEIDYTSQASSIISDIKAQGYSEANISTVKTLLDAASLNMPKAGTFLRIKSYAQDAYVSSRVDETVAEGYRTSYTDNNEATDPGTIWYYDGTGLLNYSTGLYTSNRMAAAVGNTGSTVTFSEATNGIGKYWIKPSDANYWYAGVPTLDNYSAPATVENTLFTLEPVSELKVSLTNLDAWGVEGCYTTLYMPVAVKISEEATAYAVVKNADGATLDMVACPDNVVPANTGVILNGNYAQCTATLSTEAGTATSVLTGTTPMIGTVDGCYVLSVVNEKLGFYKFVGTELKGFRAFYVDETADPTRGFVLNTGDLTGINPSLLTGDASQVYDLQGRRVVNAQKGLYIINGKKVVK